MEENNKRSRTEPGKHQYLRNTLRKGNLQKAERRRKIKKASFSRKSWKDNMKEKSGQVQPQLQRSQRFLSVAWTLSDIQGRSDAKERGFSRAGRQASLYQKVDRMDVNS